MDRIAGTDNFFEHATQRGRHRNLLNGERRSAGASAHIEQTGDRRANFALIGWRGLFRGVVGGSMPVVARRKKVTVGRKAVTELTRQREPAPTLLRPHQQFSAAVRPGSNDHVARSNFKLFFDYSSTTVIFRAALFFISKHATHRPSCGVRAFVRDATHGDASEDIGSVAVGVGKVICAQRALGVVVASGEAVATFNAAVQNCALGGDGFQSRWHYSDIGRAYGLVELLTQPFHVLAFGSLSCPLYGLQFALSTTVKPAPL